MYPNMIVNRLPFLTADNRGYMFHGMRYGERLKAARLYAELTQMELAERCGIAQPTISELEATDGGSAYTTRLARACGVSPDWLADEIGGWIIVPQNIGYPIFPVDSFIGFPIRCIKPAV